MAILKQGGSININIDSESTYYIKTTGEARYRHEKGSQYFPFVRFDSSTTIEFDEYGKNEKLYIEALSGRVEYSTTSFATNDIIESPSDVTFEELNDSVNGLIGLTTKPSRGVNNASDVAYLGDSITNVSGKNTLSSEEFHQHVFLKGVQHSGKYGEGGMGLLVSGTTTGLTVDECVDNIIASDNQPTYVNVLLGTNDLGTQTFVDIRNKYIEIVELLEANNYVVIVSELLPRNDLSDGSSELLKLHTFNVWVNRWAKLTGRLCNHLYSACVSSDGLGNWVSGYNKDSVHPNTTGAIAIANVIYKTITNYEYIPYLAMDNGDATGLLNPVFLNDVRTSGSSAEVAGDGVPDYIGTANSTVYTKSLVTGSDVIGNWFKVTSTGVDDAGIFRSFKIPAVVGDVVQIGLKVKNALVGSAGCEMGVSAYASNNMAWVGSSVGLVGGMLDQATARYDVDNYIFIEFVVEYASCVGVYVDISVRQGDGNVSDAYFGQFSVRNLTDLSID